MGDGFEKSWSLKEFGGEWVSLGRSFLLAFPDLGKSGAFSQAAAISYYAILSIFPFLMLLVVVSTRLLENPALSVQAIRLLGSYMPNGRQFLSDTLPVLQRISGTLGAVSVAGLAWSSMGLFAALRTALDGVGGDNSPPSPVLQRWASFLAVLFSSLGLLLGLAVATLLSFLARLSFQILSLGISQLDPMANDLPKLLLRPAGLAIQAGTLALSAVVTWAGIFLLLHHLPRRKPALRNALVPALGVTLALDQLKGLFLLVVGSNKNLTVVQGPLAAAIAFMVWAYLSALVLLFGGAWTFRLGRERLQRSRVRHVPPRPL
jgi:YihY family inner membrane protein